MPEMRVEIALALDVPVEDAVGPGHDQRLLRPLGHLVADEDLPEEGFLGRLGLGRSGRAETLAACHRDRASLWFSRVDR